MNAQPVKRKKDRRALYLRVHRVMIPETGELVGALLPESIVSQREMRERALKTGDVVRCELRKKRNPRYWRLVHALGGLLADQAEGYEGLSQHKALKKLQRDANVECDQETFDIPDLGTVTRSAPRSLSFDELDEQAFDVAWAQMVAHASKALKGLDEETIQQLCDSVAGE
ncbi:MAG: hypothetical protein ACTHMO_12835 [Rhodanobacteraceae bacterium]